MKSPTRILLLEMDACEKSLIQHWSQAGFLPHLKSLLTRGLVGHTTPPPGLYVGAIWPSFFTGVSPARHGIHALAPQLKPGSYDVVPYSPDQVKREPFWNALSRAGKRVAIFDVPFSGVSEGLNGIQSVEYGAHDAIGGFRTWPPSLAGEITSRFGRYPITDCNANRRSPEEFLALRDDLVLGVRKKAELTRHYLDRGGWDFFAQVFTESHCAGHQFWHLHDPRHPSHEPDVARRTGYPIRDVYVALDTAVGEILAHVGEHTLVVVLAGHGMTTRRGAQFLLHEVLVRLGVAVPAPPSPEQPRNLLDQLDAVLTRGWQRTPPSLKRALQPFRRRLRGWMDKPQGPPPSRLDKARGKCFLVDNHFAYGAIRINLRGREPQGIVRPGAEADALCRQLTADLLEVRDAVSGHPAIRRVMRTRDLYRGEYIDQLPDLLVEWSTDVPLGTSVVGRPGSGRVRLTSAKIAMVEGENHYCRTGDHLPDGMFMATGPGIEPGAVEGEVSIMNFAPTFAKLLDVELPDVDGGPIAELCNARVRT